MKEPQAARMAFNQDSAQGLSDQVRSGLTSFKASDRFAFFRDSKGVVVVAGAQEGRNVDLALAYGLKLMEKGELDLVLPSGYEVPTLQRIPWLNTTSLRVFVHDRGEVVDVQRPTQEEAQSRLLEHLKGETPLDELRKAWTPLHLGETSAVLDELVEWATKHPQLDHGHRQQERSWHFMGQKVLSVKSSKAELRIRAGIHDSATDESGLKEGTISVGENALGTEDLEVIKQRVKKAIQERLSGTYSGRDEHWLQSVIRKNPSLVGVEQPALREVPAWRPVIDEKPERNPKRSWGRGFIDLIGLDGHGDIRIVETKLSSNSDDLLVLQGIDYFVWAQVYKDALLQRLGAGKKSRLRLHYVLGASQGDKVHLSPHARTHAGLLKDIAWRFQVIKGWAGDPADLSLSSSELLKEEEIPHE